MNLEVNEVKPRKRLHYINNKEFLDLMDEYKKKVDAAEAVGDKPPPIPDSIGKCFISIANGLSRKHNFINYPFRDEMIADGIENAVTAVNNFTSEKTKNPFGYFTTVMYYAFVRRIQKEKKQLYVRHKVIEQSMIFDTLATNTEDSKSQIKVDLDTEYMKDFVQTYEDNLEKNKQPKKKEEPSGLETFIEEE